MAEKQYIGHFMYNQYTNTLYNYELADPDALDFYYSEMLGREVKRNKTLHKDIMTKDDYNKCRGRVFLFKDVGKDAKPVIVVGDWIIQYPQALDKVKELFNLSQDTPVYYHKHWNIDNNIELK